MVIWYDTWLIRNTENMWAGMYVGDCGTRAFTINTYVPKHQCDEAIGM